MRTNSPFIPEDVLNCITTLSIRHQLRILRACLVSLFHYLAVSLSDSRPARQDLRSRTESHGNISQERSFENDAEQVIK